MKRYCALLFVVCAFGVTNDAAAGVLRVLYDERPPYYTADAQGNVGGVVSGPVDSALKAAGIEAEWVRMPSSRQIFTIHNDSEYACSPGWFRNPEREGYAKFSVPVYRDKPQVIAVRGADLDRFDHSTLAEVMADTTLILGVKSGYSYGPVIDALIEENRPVTVSTVQTVDGMREMLSHRRFDYFLTTPEEFDVLVAAGHGGVNGIVQLEFPDIPAGNERFLMCALQVEDDLIERFNAAFGTVQGGAE